LQFASCLGCSRCGPGSKAYRELTHYRHCAELLEERLPGSPLLASLRRELTQLALLQHPEELAGAT
jgi:hypothetical protein